LESLAILVGNSEYDYEKELPCCLEDLAAINELLGNTEKFSKIETLANYNADDLKESIRNVIDEFGVVEEVFFYFTGHGAKIGENFFYCATNFTKSEPNTTGLSDVD